MKVWCRGGGSDDGGPFLAMGGKGSSHQWVSGFEISYYKEPYGDSKTVRPKGYAVRVWVRTS